MPKGEIMLYYSFAIIIKNRTRIVADQADFKNGFNLDKSK